MTLKQIKNIILVVITGVIGGCGAKGGDKPKAVALTSTTTASGYFNNGKIAAEEGDWDNAAVLFADALKLDSKNQNIKVNWAIALERSGNLAKAIVLYQEILKNDLANQNAAVNVARVLVATEKYSEAERVLANAVKEDDDNADLQIKYAGVLRKTKKYKKAIKAARKVLLRDQQNVSAIKSLALIYADQSRFQLAETFFRNALKLDEEDAEIHVNLGLIAFGRKQTDIAVLEFQRAIEINPNTPAAYANLGAIALRFRDYQRAVKNYKLATEQGLVNCTTSAALGFSYEGAQLGKEAVAQLLKTYDSCGEQHNILFSVGKICLGQLRDNQCALKNFELFRERMPKLSKDHLVYSYIQNVKDMIEMDAQGPEMLENEGEQSMSDTAEGEQGQIESQSGAEQISVLNNSSDLS